MIGTSLDIHAWLERDQDTALERRLERDRALGEEIDASGDGDRVLAWWRRIDETGDGAGARVQRAQRQATLGLALLGLVLGWLAGAAAFAYDGRAPINLLVVLGVLVGLPGFFLLLTLLAAAGRGLGLAGWARALSVTAVGRLGLGWIARMSGGRFDLHDVATERLAFWMLFVCSQIFAIGFFAGVLTVCLATVAFTDLAFGWSSTLQLSPESVHGVFTALALPWASVWPDVVPTLELVSESRYYRLENGTIESGRAAALGGWWGFVLASIVVWGVLPRIVLLVLGRWRMAAADRAFLLGHMEVVALVDRLDAGAVEFRADREAAHSETTRESVPALTAPAGGGVPWIEWNGALALPEVSRWAELQGVDMAAVVTLGVLNDDAEISSALSGLGRPERVVLAAKGWEPPTLEFVDFLAAVRRAVGDRCMVVVLPVSLSGGVEAGERQIYAEALSGSGDSRIYVAEAA